MGRPVEDPVAEFLSAVRELYVALGAPAYRVLAEGVTENRLAVSTLGDLLTGTAKPRWSTVERFVLAGQAYVRRRRRTVAVPDLDVGHWMEKYQQMEAALERGRRRPPARHWIGVPPPTADCFQNRTVEPAVLLSRGATSVLSGLGGVGKTQVAAGLARQAWADERIDMLVWVTAATRQSVLVGYGLAARELLGAEATVVEHAAARFLARLANTDQRWLVVLDDVTDPGDLAGLWPPAPEASDGRVVVTTRRRDSALRTAGRQLVDLSLFTADEAQAYLGARLADHPHLTPGLPALAADLGHLPLALAQASAYLIDRDITCQEYRERLTDRRRQLDDLLPEPGTLPDDQQATLTATWSLSIERADALNPAGLARPLLELVSCLDPNGTPAQILTTDAAVSYLAAHRGTTASKPVTPADARDALRCLYRVNLATIVGASDDGIVKVHALVQRVTRDALGPERTGAAALAAADAIGQAWPAVDSDAALAQSLRDCVDALTASAGDLLWTDRVHPVLLRAAHSTGDLGDIAGALAALSRLLATALRRWEPDHPDILQIRHHLAYWRGQGGDPAGAGAAAESLIADLRRVLGPDHHDTLAAELYLPRWIGQAGDPGRAATALAELIPRLARHLGAEHEDTLTARNDLAYFQGQAGDPAGAAAAFTTLLEDRLRTLGPDHPHTLTNRNDLYVSQGESGDPDSAVTGLADLVPDMARILGPDHPKTLAARGNLARWRGQAGDPAQAVQQLGELVMDFQRAVGPDHPFTLRTHRYLEEWQGRESSS